MERPSSKDAVEPIDTVASLALNLNIPWILRVQSRTKDLCRWFAIPETEGLRDDYACALRKRILLQGKLFIFDHYVCFNTNVFGYVKRKVIPIKDIVAVRKKTHLKFPNSIEIEDSHGNKEFFTSFLTRERAFRTIVTLWGRERPGLVDPSILQEDGLQQSTQASAYFARSSEPFVNAGNSALPSLLAPASTGPASSFLEMFGFARRRSALNPSTSASKMLREGSTLTEEPSPGTEATDCRMRTRDLDEDEADGGEVRDEEDDNDDSTQHDSVWSVVELGPVAPLHKDSKLLVSTTLPGTLKDLFEVLLGNDSHFMEDALEQLGNRRINIGTWKRTEQLGHIRDVQFVAPIKGAFSNWGVPQTRCFVTHRVCRYASQHLLFESSQTNTDIPYGDCFTVDKRWDVRPDPQASPQQPAMLVEVHLQVPFSRMCFFRKIIESGTFGQSKDTVSFLLHRLREALEEREVQRPRAEPGVLLPASSLPGSHLLSPSDSIHNELMGGASRASLSYRAPGTTTDRADAASEDSSAVSWPRAAAGRGVVGAVGSGMARAVLTPVRVARGWISSSDKGTVPHYQAAVWLLLLVVCAAQLYSLLLALRSASAPAVDQQTTAGAGSSHLAVSYVFQEQDRSYLLQRLQLLQQELQQLQHRTEAVSAELASVMAGPLAGAAGEGAL